MSFKSTLCEVKDRINHRVVLVTLARLLEYLGIQISLYFITLEARREGLDPDLEPGLTPVAAAFLSRDEIQALYTHPEIKRFAAEADKWLAEGCLCFALKHGAEVVAYAWCNLTRCNSNYYAFPLKLDEAYLFRARTFSRYRGNNLAPRLRYELYKNLNAVGRIRFYSITEYFNTPAINFKNKLKARPYKLCLYLGFFHRRIFNITLKKYPV